MCNVINGAKASLIWCKKHSAVTPFTRLNRLHPSTGWIATLALAAGCGLFSGGPAGASSRLAISPHNVPSIDTFDVTPAPPAPGGTTPANGTPASAPSEDGHGHHRGKKQTPPEPLPDGVSAEEAKLGKEGAKEVEQQLDIVKDPVGLAKIQSIVNTLEKSTPYPNLPYKVAIVAPKKKGPEPDINAFSLPGGYIYVTKDLLDSIQSDDELAAVLGHEMGHVVHHHEIKQMKAMSKDTLYSMIAILASLVASGGRPGEGTADVAMMGPQIVQALHSGHSMMDETEADMSGIDYVYNSHKYNPVGMLSFMERLAQDEHHHPQVELGYLQDHPLSSHRVSDIEARLKSLQVPINLRSVSHVLTASTLNDLVGQGVTLRVQGLNKPTVLFHFSSEADGMSVEARAQAAVKAINDCVDRGVEMGELSTRSESSGTSVLWGTTTLFTVTEQEGARSYG
ncbi:MAG: M48 family metalloprotease, partial [Armatimonadota bacterium]|nr:M48 family metalloprotease [Armatimonadota bacterium]